MAALVTVETIILALMALLIVGLLRSHAEILRRLDSIAPEGAAAGEPTVGTDLPPARANVTPAFDIAGATLDGDAAKLAMATGRPGGTLVAFLSSGCLSCRAFWDGLRAGHAVELPGAPRVLVVTKDSSHESPSKLRELAAPDVPLVMSSRAWEDYQIAGSPYFVHVSSGGSVLGEGTAGTWAQVASLIRDAMDDANDRTAREGGTGMSPAERVRRADAELASAGIGPGHPSLYGVQPPAGSDGDDGS